MHVLFLEVDHERDWAVASIGPAYIAAYLRRHGHPVSLLRVPFDQPLAIVADRVAKTAPDLIGVSLTSRQWLRARDVIAAVRQRLDIPVIAGGLHATFAADAILESPGFDYCCLGEGEEPMLDLVEALARNETESVTAIRNIQARAGERPMLRPPFSPIDELPFMARDMLDERYGVVHMATQRGCPYPCTYCAARQFSDLYGSYADYGRRRSHANVLDELDTIRSNGDLNYVVFLDDTFTINHRWVREFCSVYAERFRVPFSLHARVETISETMLAELADAGCRHIVYGVESGSERVRREIMRRNASNERFIDVFAWTRAAGILVTANYILGTPGETGAEIEQTLALHDELAPDDFGYFVFYPYPGTALFEQCIERGYLPPDYLELPANHRRSVLSLPDLDAHQIEFYYQRFTDKRHRDQLRRLAPDSSDNQRQTLSDDVRKSASLG